MVGQSKRLAEPMSKRQKRGLAISLAVLVIAIGAATVYGVVHHTSLDTSGAGCVNLTVPSSLGAAILHGCGAKARAMCADAQVHDDTISKLLRPQCVLAGYPPVRSSG